MGELIDPTPLKGRIEEKITQLFELNQRIGGVLRNQAKSFEEIGSTFHALSNRAYELSSMIAELALIAAHNTGDIIMAEFDIEEDDGEEDDDES